VVRQCLVGTYLRVTIVSKTYLHFPPPVCIMHLCIKRIALPIKLTDWLEYQILSEGFLVEKIPNTLYNVSIEKPDACLQVKIHGSIVPLWLVNQTTHFLSPRVTRLIPDLQGPESIHRYQLIIKKSANRFH